MLGNNKRLALPFRVQRFRVQRFRGSGFRGFCGDKKRISNVEGMYSARREFLCRTVYLIIKTEQSETTLRYSAVRYSTVLRFAFVFAET